MKPDTDLFRHCMGRFATGITVVSTKSVDGTNVGITINSFNSVSLDPLLILYSIRKSSHFYPYFDVAKNCTVNILSEHQAHLSKLFTVADPNNWNEVETANGTITSSPAIKDAIAFLECEIYDRHEGGDHTIFICKVINIVEQSPANPLIYYSRKYRTLADEPI